MLVVPEDKLHVQHYMDSIPHPGGGASQDGALLVFVEVFTSRTWSCWNRSVIGDPEGAELLMTTINAVKLCRDSFH